MESRVLDHVLLNQSIDRSLGFYKKALTPLGAFVLDSDVCHQAG